MTPTGFICIISPVKVLTIYFDKLYKNSATLTNRTQFLYIFKTDLTDRFISHKTKSMCINVHKHKCKMRFV